MKKSWKYSGIIWLIIVFLWTCGLAYGASSPEIASKAAILLETEQGKVLYQKNPEQELPMASVTKLMTLLLAVEAEHEGKLSLEESITASERASSMGGSQIYLAAGESMPFRDLLISVAVGSANDACIAIAEHLQGSVEEFVRLMNQKAVDLGLKHTHFANPTGLPAEDHYSCAADLAVILQSCLQYPLFKEVSGIYEYDLRGGEFKLWSTNKLLKQYQGVDAGKTGWTSEAGFCLASTCQRGDLRLVAVVLGGEGNGSHFAASMKLYDYGFANFQALVLAKAGEKIKSVPISRGTESEVNLVLDKDVKLVTDNESARDFQVKLECPEQIKAPCQDGESLGWYLVYQQGQEIARAKLITEKAVEKAGFWQQMQKVWKSFF